MMDTFVEAGGNFLDSAYIYACWIPGGDGSSEKTIGRWAEARGCRNDVIIGTKGCTLDMKTLEYPKFLPEQIAAEFNESLDRLRTDYVDIYWLHRDNPAMPVGEILEKFQPYLASGRARNLGASNWSPTRLKEAAEYAKAHGIRGFCGSEIGWSLATTVGALTGDATTLFMNPETYAYHLESGMPIVAFSSQGRGFFTGRAEKYLAQDEPRDPGSLQPYINDDNFRKLRVATEIARKRGVAVNDVAVAYISSHPFPSAAIVGPLNVSELKSSLGAADIKLTPEEVAQLRGQGI